MKCCIMNRDAWIELNWIEKRSGIHSWLCSLLNALAAFFPHSLIHERIFSRQSIHHKLNWNNNEMHTATGTAKRKEWFKQSWRLKLWHQTFPTQLGSIFYIRHQDIFSAAFFCFIFMWCGLYWWWTLRLQAECVLLTMHLRVSFFISWLKHYPDKMHMRFKRNTFFMLNFASWCWKSILRRNGVKNVSNFSF